MISRRLIIESQQQALGRDSSRGEEEMMMFAGNESRGRNGNFSLADLRRQQQINDDEENPFQRESGVKQAANMRGRRAREAQVEKTKKVLEEDAAKGRKSHLTNSEAPHQRPFPATTALKRSNKFKEEISEEDDFEQEIEAQANRQEKQVTNRKQLEQVLGRDGRRGRAVMKQSVEEREEEDDDYDYRHFDPYSVYGEEDEEEDVWYSEERLFEDHIKEIVDKWFAIDDEIWAKIICLERNRRIAKAYARKHSLIVNGSEDEYLDGTTLGLNSFENPDRDTKTRHIKQYIGQGLRIKITQTGDILVKRLSKANVFVHSNHFGSNNNNNNNNNGWPNERPVRTMMMKSARGGCSNSSSDPYALNSESGDLYGFVGSANLTGLVRRAPLTGHQLAGTKNGKQAKVRAGCLQVKQSIGENLMNSAESSTSSSSASNIINNHRTAHDNDDENDGYAYDFNGTNCDSVALEYNRPYKVFDMSRYKALLEEQSRRAYPNRKFLQSQCISVLSFVVDDHKLLNLPSWIMIINIVAIDLLKTELGLEDAQEHQLFASSMNQPDPFSDQHRFGRPTRNDLIKASSPLPLSGGGERICQNQFSASKKAFANAAALGAYNGKHYNSQDPTAMSQGSSDQVANKQRVFSRQHVAQQQQRKWNAGSGSGSGSDQAHKIKRGAKKMLLNDGDNSNSQQQSSSSSGFNSHSSLSQNENGSSSAASSNSNIAADELKAQAMDDMKQVHVGANQEPGGNECCLNPGAVSRGKRLPKLPHRISSELPRLSSKVSEPIPIPAPPTSAGGGPSGKANLILVAPTGLSPPLPKRKLGGPKLVPKYHDDHQHQPSALESHDRLNGGNHDAEANRFGASRYMGQVPEFTTIKHIDENGRECGVAMTNRSQLATPAKLPVGIPAHAQLAPPATQRHILRYLMSATRSHNLVPETGAYASTGARIQAGPAPKGSTDELQQQTRVTAARASPPPPPMINASFLRPLPVLPNQRSVPAYGHLSREANQRRRQEQDESLYYCGMQARVPVRRPVPPAHPVTKSAINAILSDFRRNSNNQQERPKYLKPAQFSLTDLRQVNNNFQNNYSSAINQPVHQTRRTGKPLMKFFRSPGGLEGANKRAPYKNDSMFLSVDNLPQSISGSQKSSTKTSTIMSFAMKFRGSSKNKKSSVEMR